MAEEESINVQVARALGWVYDPKHHGPYSRPGQYPWRGPDGLWVMSIPDYLHDKAWAVDMLEVNREHIHEIQLSGGVFTAVAMRIGGPTARGRTLAEMMCRWLLAAKAAGIEIQL